MFRGLAGQSECEIRLTVGFEWRISETPTEACEARNLYHPTGHVSAAQSRRCALYFEDQSQLYHNPKKTANTKTVNATLKPKPKTSPVRLGRLRPRPSLGSPWLQSGGAELRVEGLRVSCSEVSPYVCLSLRLWGLRAFSGILGALWVGSGKLWPGVSHGLL